MVTMGREPVPKETRAIKDLVGQQRPRRSFPVILVMIGVAAIVITAAWIALLGYGAWYLLDWAVG